MNERDTSKMYIGMYPRYSSADEAPGPRYLFKGKMYDTRFYTEYPSTTDIELIKDHEIVLTGLVARYKMDEGAGLTAYDSVKRNEGTISNTSLTHEENSEYSFHTYLGRTDGDGTNGAPLGVYIPRYELDKAYDVENNLLSTIGYLTNGIRNEVFMETNQGDVEDEAYVIVKYDRENDLYITKSGSGSHESGGIITWTIDYINSGYNEQTNVTITEDPGPYMTGYGND